MFEEIRLFTVLAIVTAALGTGILSFVAGYYIAKNRFSESESVKHLYRTRGYLIRHFSELHDRDKHELLEICDILFVPTSLPAYRLAIKHPGEEEVAGYMIDLSGLPEGLIRTFTNKRAAGYKTWIWREEGNLRFE